MTHFQASYGQRYEPATTQFILSPLIRGCPLLSHEQIKALLIDELFFLAHLLYIYLQLLKELLRNRSASW